MRYRLLVMLLILAGLLSFIVLDTIGQSMEDALPAPHGSEKLPPWIEPIAPIEPSAAGE